MMRVAVIGSGAAAAAVIHTLLKSAPGVEITLFDIGRKLENRFPASHPEHWSSDDYARLHRAIKADLGVTFPPPKAHCGQPIARYAVGTRPRLWRSESFGGLTNYWGGTMLPFVEADFARWPIGRADLTAQYRDIADLVGIAGRPDALTHYFGDEFSNRPPIRPLPILSKLDDSINGRPPTGEYVVLSGVNRVAIETREDASRACVACGECLYGCFAGSIYSAAQTIEPHIKAGRVAKVLEGRVLSINSGRSITLQSGGSRARYDGYAKVFVCAGSLGSAEILMRSLGLREGVRLMDNAVYLFPMLYLGSNAPRTPRLSSIALSHLILGCVPRKPGLSFAQVQVYPTADYLWRYYVPPSWWGLLDGLSSTLKARLFWGKLYLHSDDSPRYAVSLASDDTLALEPTGRTVTPPVVKGLMRSVRAAVNAGGFYAPPVPAVAMGTSSHYAGTLPYGERVIPVPSNGEVMPGVYLCDSAVFPDCPAQSPTFTLMANAARTASQAVHG